jgi:hypothetical protein
MRYFVTVDNITAGANLTKNEAIILAKKKYESVKSTLRVGIGKEKYFKGKLIFTCLPMHFFTD